MIQSELRHLLQDAVELTQVEMKATAQETARASAGLIVTSVLAIVGILPFVAFMVIGLGQLMGGRYWLSALVMSILCFGVGGAGIFYFLRMVKAQDFTLPKSRDCIAQEALLLKRAVDPSRRPFAQLGLFLTTGLSIGQALRSQRPRSKSFGNNNGL